MPIGIEFIRLINGTQNTDSERDFHISQQKQQIIDGFEYSPSYHKVSVNTLDQGVLIVDQQSLTKDTQRKKIIAKPDENIKVGDLVKWKSENWLCTEVDVDDTIQTKGIISLCNNTLKWQTITGEIISQPCITTNYSLYNDGVKEGKLITFPDATLSVIMPNNEENIKLDRDKRLVLNNKHIYKITLADDYTKLGLILFTLVEDLNRSPGDRLDLGIADYKEPKQPSLINGADSIKYNRTETYTVDTPSTFEIVYGSTPTNALTMTVLSDNSCSIKALKYPYTITLRATDNSTGTVVEKQIQLVSLM